MICDVPGWIKPTYDVIAGPIAFGLIYVSLKVNRDALNDIDPRWLKRARRAGFVATALATCAPIGFPEFMVEILFALFALGGALVIINALSLYLRNRPQSGVSARIPVSPAGIRRRPH